MSLDVIIIGGGPVGLTLANLLGRRGVYVLVLEKQPAPYPMPRAIHFDGEAMRCFQAAGVATQVLPHTHIGKGMLFADPEGNVLIDWSRAQDVGPMGWHESYRFFQPGLEQVLRDALSRYPNATLRAGADVASIDGPTVTLGGGEQVSARFVVACDGANSPTREALGCGQHDLGFRERWLVVDLRLKRPRPDLGDHSVQFCDSDAPATYVRGVGNWRRWEMRLGPDDPDPMPEPEIWDRLMRWITPEDAALERGAVYVFRSRIAKRWRVGPVFLAGDAAHQMPPFMGQGMCAGIRDAANLWWKLLAVLNGYDDNLLNSYQSEREANARCFIDRSVALGQLINQTARGAMPSGKMQSIWPDLGPGLGPRDGIGGALAPQAKAGRADDHARHRFYTLGAPADNMESFVDEWGWLAKRGASAVVVRPDGYALGPVTEETRRFASVLNPYLAPRGALS